MYTTQFYKNLGKLHNSCWKSAYILGQFPFWSPLFFFLDAVPKIKKSFSFSPYHNLTNKIVYVANEVHLDTLNAEVAINIILNFFI